MSDAFARLVEDRRRNFLALLGASADVQEVRTELFCEFELADGQYEPLVAARIWTLVCDAFAMLDMTRARLLEAQAVLQGIPQVLAPDGR